MSTNVAPDFVAYPKTPRLFRDIVITEKLDGTNSQIVIEPASDAELAGHIAGKDFCVSGDFAISAGSRNRWITPLDDNYRFAQWVLDNKNELVKLGPGRHFGEWWGGGIQRGYGLAGNDKRFSLFNVARWGDGATGNTTDLSGKVVEGVPLPPRPACCGVVPVLYRGEFNTWNIKGALDLLAGQGSAAVPGYRKPEGIIVFHTAASVFKVLLENDEAPKGTGE